MFEIETERQHKRARRLALALDGMRPAASPYSIQLPTINSHIERNTTDDTQP